jgi:hypothetical protein
MSHNQYDTIAILTDLMRCCVRKKALTLKVPAFGQNNLSKIYTKPFECFLTQGFPWGELMYCV